MDIVAVVPRLYTAQSVREIRWQLLHDSGIRWAMFDIENTLEPIARRGHAKQFTPNTRQFLVGLQRIGYGIGLATNSTADFAEMSYQMAANGINEAVFMQPGPGKKPKKPQPAYYKALTLKADCPPSRAIFVDDKLVNVLAAIDFGMHGIWVKPLGRDLHFAGIPIERPRRWREEHIRRRVGCPRP